MIFGAPGSGKGTFVSQIRSILPNIIHISTGDIFRENIRNQTELGKRVKQFLDRGELVPDSLTNELIKDKLDKIKNKSWILDGYPRTLNQAQYLDSITTIDSVLQLVVDKNIIMKRLTGRVSCPKCNEIYNIYTLPPKKEGICDKCGAELKHRSDDTEETVNNRLDVYKKNAKPIIEHYKNKNLLQKIDSTDTLAMSEEEIKKTIGYRD